jgi:hypothetical protein
MAPTAYTPLSAVTPDLAAAVIRAVHRELVAAGVIASDHPFDEAAAREGAENACGSLSYLAGQIALYGAAID